jgi:hypothetical protein
MVEAHLDYVGVRGCISRAAELLHRSSGDGDAHQRIAHGHQKRKSLLSRG